MYVTRACVRSYVCVCIKFNGVVVVGVVVVIFDVDLLSYKINNNTFEF